MPSLRRRTASGLVARRQSRNVIDTEMAKGRYSFIYHESFQKELPVKHCVPIEGIRSISHHATAELMKNFSVDENGVIGYSAAGGLKVVTKLPEEELGIVREYFLSKGENDREATDKAFSQGIEWYGIVDGVHVHTALMNLQDFRPDPFMDFQWTVTVIKWHSLDTLRAFGRARNALQSSHVTDMTVFDTLHALHGIANKKARLSGSSLEDILKVRGIVKEVADEYSGGSNYSRETIRTLTGAALRLKPDALRTLGKIMNESDLELSKKVLERNGASSIGNVVTDDRAYRHLISTNTIRGAPVFLRAEGVDQSNALERLKNAFEENGFKCFQAARLNKETERSMKARHQLSLMNELMGRESWPQEMMDVQNKLLLTSVFDSELDESDEKQDRILQSLVSMYKQRMPLEAGIRWVLYCRERNLSTAAQSNTQSSYSRPDVASNDAESLISDRGDDEVERPEPQNECPLAGLGIQCHKLTLEDFLVHRDKNEEKFHLVLGDPSELHRNGTCKRPIDGPQADKTVAILKSLVHPHGWVFFYTRPVDFHLWDKAFKANDFDPLQFAWPMIRNCNTIQSNTSVIPQNVTELLIGARKKNSDSSTPDFQPDTTTAYERNVCSRKRKFAILDCCAEATFKLRKRNTREPIRKNERSAEPIAEFLRTFCPEQGNVLDAFAGTMEAAKACILTSRRCTSLEADPICFNLSVERLKESASVYLRSSSDTINVFRDDFEGRDTCSSDVENTLTIENDNVRGSSEEATVCDQCPSTSESELDQEIRNGEEQAQ